MPTDKQILARKGGEFIAMLMTRCGCTNVVKMMGASPPDRIELPLAPPFQAERRIVSPHEDIPVEKETRVFLRTAGLDEAYGMPVYRFLETAE